MSLNKSETPKLIKFEDESKEIYNGRINFISLAKKKYPNKFTDSELIKYSKIWSNIRFKGCKYSPKIYHLIRSINKDLKRKVEDYIEEDTESDNSDEELSVDSQMSEESDA